MNYGKQSDFIFRIGVAIKPIGCILDRASVSLALTVLQRPGSEV